jgi:NAD(P)-dependent dehydrogenase (short-subunit alcohol dehydrogenase family)
VSLAGKVAVVTGGAGVLCSEMCLGLAQKGVKVAVLDINENAAKTFADSLVQKNCEAIGVGANVLDRASLEKARDRVLEKYKTVDILINGAGGNKKEATVNPDQTFFDISPDALRWVFDLNFTGTVLTSQVFGKILAEKKQGVIINISSMNAYRPLTNVLAYSAAKAAVSNFTQWLAVHLNQNYSPEIRVNAIAPGFFLTEQNRYLLTDQQGNMTARGQAIISHTPMERYGDPKDLVGAILYLVSDEAKFVNGVVLPIDGAFSAFSGV